MEVDAHSLMLRHSKRDAAVIVSRHSKRDAAVTDAPS